MIECTVLGKQGKSPHIWYSVDGYITTLTELSVIFNLHHVTLRQRLRFGWDLIPACLIPNTVKMTFKDVNILSQDPTLEVQFREKLIKYFGRPSPTNFKG
jgi:hypothetical protein